MYGSDVTILLTYGSHDVRHIDFRRLTVVNGIPGIGVSHCWPTNRHHFNQQFNG